MAAIEQILRCKLYLIKDKITCLYKPRPTHIFNSSKPHPTATVTESIVLFWPTVASLIPVGKLGFVVVTAVAEEIHRIS